jgi:hypothetical protein
VKDFLPIAFNHDLCLQEVLALRDLLASKSDLEENRDIKPFFASHRQLAAFLGSYSEDLVQYDLLAYEYQLFGDFACDLVVGDSHSKTYGFVELEEGTAASIFRRQGQKATLEWSTCFEHGLSQIIDWFWKLDDMAHTDEFEARFGVFHTSACSWWDARARSRRPVNNKDGNGAGVKYSSTRYPSSTRPTMSCATTCLPACKHGTRKTEAEAARECGLPSTGSPPPTKAVASTMRARAWAGPVHPLLFDSGVFGLTLGEASASRSPMANWRPAR